jgi:hypothetical protein
MAKVELVDYLGFTVGEPEIPEPFPRIIVWGDDFFLFNEAQKEKLEKPRYQMTTGFVVVETRPSRLA